MSAVLCTDSPFGSASALLQAEADRQAREGMRPGALKTSCGICGKPFVFGTVDSDANVYSMAGARETQITGTCESCFDGLFEDLDDDDEGGAA